MLQLKDLSFTFKYPLQIIYMSNNLSANAISVDSFTLLPEVLDCIRQLETTYGKDGVNLIVSDVLDKEGHQYVNIVQKGGGVLGIALVGYTYILELMGIRFIRLAGTSAGAINTALMAVVGAETITSGTGNDQKTKVIGNKKLAKSKEILKVICDLNFFDLVDGHPAARFLIKSFITNDNFAAVANKWIRRIIITLIALPVLDFIFLGLQHQVPWISFLTKLFFVLTGFFLMLLIIGIAYISYLVNRLKDSGFGVNPGDFFYDWIKQRLRENHVNTVSDLIDVASTPVPDLYIRNSNASTDDLHGDVTFIASEIITQNKIEFPHMWNLFRENIDELQPAGFIRASMSIPLFFESYFIDNIPCSKQEIKDAWQILGEDDPPTTARFVDGGILSNFPINLFYNENVIVPRLPSFGIDLDDEKDAAEVFGSSGKPGAPDNTILKVDTSTPDDAGKHAQDWSFGGYLYRIFNTVRFYYDKDFLLKNTFFKKGIGVIPLKGYNWLNFFLDKNAKQQMFILGAKAATKFLLEDFRWQDYKEGRVDMHSKLKDAKTTVTNPLKTN
jgi:NTE family protein